MKKSKWLVPALLILAIVAAAGLGVTGCAKNSSGGQNSSAPTVTTDSGQASGSSQPAQSGQQQASANGQITTQSGQQQTQAKGQPAGKSAPQQMQASMKKALSGLVAKGTITQAQADKIVQAFTNNKPSQGQGGRQGKGPLDTLVANGTLTQSQADAVKQALPQPSNKGGGPVTGQANDQ